MWFVKKYVIFFSLYNSRLLMIKTGLGDFHGLILSYGNHPQATDFKILDLRLEYYFLWRFTVFYKIRFSFKIYVFITYFISLK